MIREDINKQVAIGGLVGGVDSSLVIKYPDSVEKSIYATIEPFEYQVGIYFNLFPYFGILNINLISQVWIGIGISLVGAIGCSNLIIYVIGRLMKINEITIYSAAFSVTIHLFKVIIAQGIQVINIKE